MALGRKRFSSGLLLWVVLAVFNVAVAFRLNWSFWSILYLVEGQCFLALFLYNLNARKRSPVAHQSYLGILDRVFYTTCMAMVLLDVVMSLVLIRKTL